MCTGGREKEKEEGREPTQTYGGSSGVQSSITGLAGVCAGQPTFPPFPSFKACFLFLAHSFLSLNLKTGSKTMSLHLPDTDSCLPVSLLCSHSVLWGYPGYSPHREICRRSRLCLCAHRLQHLGRGSLREVLSSPLGPAIMLSLRHLRAVTHLHCARFC